MSEDAEQAPTPAPRRIRVFSKSAPDAPVTEAYRDLDDAMRRLMGAWRAKTRAPASEAALADLEVARAEEDFESARSRFLEIASASERQPGDRQRQE